MNITHFTKEAAALAKELGGAFVKELALGLLDVAFFLGLIGFGGKLLIDLHLGIPDSIQGGAWAAFAGLFLPYLCLFVPGLGEHAGRYYRMMIAMLVLYFAAPVAQLLWNYAHPIIGVVVGAVGIGFSMMIVVAHPSEAGDHNDSTVEKQSRDDDNNTEKQRRDDDYYAEKQRRDDHNNEANLHSIQWRRP